MVFMHPNALNALRSETNTYVHQLLAFSFSKYPQLWIYLR